MASTTGGSPSWSNELLSQWSLVKTINQVKNNIRAELDSLTTQRDSLSSNESAENMKEDVYNMDKRLEELTKDLEQQEQWMMAFGKAHGYQVDDKGDLRFPKRMELELCISVSKNADFLAATELLYKNGYQHDEEGNVRKKTVERDFHHEATAEKENKLGSHEAVAKSSEDLHTESTINHNHERESQHKAVAEEDNLVDVHTASTIDHSHEHESQYEALAKENKLGPVETVAKSSENLYTEPTIHSSVLEVPQFVETPINRPYIVLLLDVEAETTENLRESFKPEYGCFMLGTCEDGYVVTAEETETGNQQLKSWYGDYVNKNTKQFIKLRNLPGKEGLTKSTPDANFDESEPDGSWLKSANIFMTLRGHSLVTITSVPSKRTDIFHEALRNTKEYDAISYRRYPGGHVLIASQSAVGVAQLQHWVQANKGKTINTKDGKVFHFKDLTEYDSTPKSSSLKTSPENKPTESLMSSDKKPATLSSAIVSTSWMHTDSMLQEADGTWSRMSGAAMDRLYLEAYRAISAHSKADSLNIPKEISDVAKHLFKQVNEAGVLKDFNQDVVIAACIYFACHNTDCRRTLAEISQSTKVDKNPFGKAIKALLKFWNLSGTNATQSSSSALQKKRRASSVSETRPTKVLKQ